VKGKLEGNVKEKGHKTEENLEIDVKGIVQ
jgi:hypothetical protein